MLDTELVRFLEFQKDLEIQEKRNVCVLAGMCFAARHDACKLLRALYFFFSLSTTALQDDVGGEHTQTHS